MQLVGKYNICVRKREPGPGVGRGSQLHAGNRGEEPTTSLSTVIGLYIYRYTHIYIYIHHICVGFRKTKDTHILYLPTHCTGTYINYSCACIYIINMCVYICTYTFIYIHMCHYYVHFSF